MIKTLKIWILLHFFANYFVSFIFCGIKKDAASFVRQSKLRLDVFAAVQHNVSAFIVSVDISVTQG